MTDIARERAFLSAQGLVIRRREEWSTQSYSSARTVSEPVEGFVLHISVTLDHGDLVGNEHADMRTIERIGNQRFGGIGFPYNAAIFDTGRLYEGQPLTRRGAHTVDDKNAGYKSTGSSRSMNYWWRAIVLPQMVTDDVTSAQVDQCARWAAAQIRAGYAKRNAIWIGHRDVAWKDCPGAVGYGTLPEIRALTEHYVRNGLGTPTPPPVFREDDMPMVYSARGATEKPFLLSDGSGLSPIFTAASAIDIAARPDLFKTMSLDPAEYDAKVEAATIADEVAAATMYLAGMHSEIAAIKALTEEELEELRQLTPEEEPPPP